MQPLQCCNQHHFHGPRIIFKEFISTPLVAYNVLGIESKNWIFWEISPKMGNPIKTAKKHKIIFSDAPLGANNAVLDGCRTKGYKWDGNLGAELC